MVIANEQGTTSAAGGAGDSDYVNGVGLGGDVNSANGGPGHVILIMAPP